MTELLLEATGVQKRYGAVHRAARRVPCRPTRRDARSHGRKRRREEHVGQDPDRRRATWTAARSSFVGRSGPSTRRRRRERPGWYRSTRSRPSSRTSPSLENLVLTETPVEAFRARVDELGLRRLDLGVPARDLPLATLRVIDLARALAIEPDVLLLDEMTAALPADLTASVLEVVARERGTARSVIFISHRMLEVAGLCDRATVLREGSTVGVVDIAPGSGAEEEIVTLMLGPAAARREGPSRRRRSHGGGKRRDASAVGAVDRGTAEPPRRHIRPARGRGAGSRRARGPGPGRAVRHPLGPGPTGNRRAPRRRISGWVPPSRLTRSAPGSSWCPRTDRPRC